MTLDDAQKRKVSEWIAEGLKLSEIQTRISSEFGLRLTYMDVRLLVDDLKLTPKDIELPKQPQTIGSAAAASQSKAPGPARAAEPESEPAPPAEGRRVSVTVDQLARPGAIVSGKVTFSDGQQAEWYLDQSGRLGVVPKQQGYKPAATDVQEFQLALQDELAKLGYV
jgi:hypothetical protein